MTATTPAEAAADRTGGWLVTGGGGFIGTRVCHALVAAGLPVQAWVRPSSAAGAALRRALPSVGVQEVDLRDAAHVAQALAAQPPAHVVHLAGIRLIGNTAHNLAAMFDTQLQGTLNLLRHLSPQARMVVAGSCEEYGHAPVPFDESRPALAQTAYAVTRLATTLACLSLAVPTVCVARLAVVYGPGQVGEMFVPALVRACAAGEPFAMSSGAQTRDFLFVEDAVRALLALVRCEAAMGQVVNVGSGVESTVRTVAEQVARLAGNAGNLQIGAVPSRPAEASRYVCAIERVRALTGWQPQVGLDEGLQRTFDWWRSRDEGTAA
jgi:nucleoside-diphosphate-sugar epimerase